jgi:hypothetical protein
MRTAPVALAYLDHEASLVEAGITAGATVSRMCSVLRSRQSSFHTTTGAALPDVLHRASRPGRFAQTHRGQKSTHGPFDQSRAMARGDVLQTLGAARCSPTAHNMQNFETVVVDDQKLPEA